jgi:hypothetical protein
MLVLLVHLNVLLVMAHQWRNATDAKKEYYSKIDVLSLVLYVMLILMENAF